VARGQLHCWPSRATNWRMKHTLTSPDGTPASRLAFGTMQFGGRADATQSRDMFDACIDAGITHFDTAHVYTDGASETLLGQCVQDQRDRLIIATKAAYTGGATRDNILASAETSRKRMQIDTPDVLYLHRFDPDTEMAESLHAFADHIDKGNIRHIGLSNESAWGTMKFLQLAKANDLPRMQSNQCVYSLIARRFDYDRAEIAMREKVGLLAYSPLGMGVLTGKYDDGDVPEGSRGALFKGFMDNYKKSSESWMDANKTARELGLTPTQFALKFVESRQFVTANIIGATSMEQLRENIDAHNIDWTDEMEQEATPFHETYRCPLGR